MEGIHNRALAPPKLVKVFVLVLVTKTTVVMVVEATKSRFSRDCSTSRKIPPSAEYSSLFDDASSIGSTTAFSSSIRDLTSLDASILLSAHYITIQWKMNI